MKPKALLIYDRQHQHAETLSLHINSIKNSRVLQVDLVGVYLDHLDHIDFERYDYLIWHYSWNPILFPIRMNIQKKIKDYHGKIVWFLQDEYRRINRVNQILGMYKIEVLFTVLPLEIASEIYGNREKCLVVQLLTGYLDTRNLTSLPVPNFSDRVIDVSYRGRYLPESYGDLGQLKNEIGERAKKICRKYDFIFDISSAENKRIYGNDWKIFLRKSRAVLGVESSVNRLDFTGHQEFFGGKSLFSKPEQYPSYLWRSPEIFKDRGIRVISPRIFEYMNAGCAMVLVEGKYSGILEAGVHYLPVKENLENLEDAILQSQDLNVWNKLNSNVRSLLKKNQMKIQDINMTEKFDETILMLNPTFNLNANQIFVYHDIPLTSLKNKSLVTKDTLNETSQISLNYSIKKNLFNIFVLIAKLFVPYPMRKNTKLYNLKIRLFSIFVEADFSHVFYYKKKSKEKMKFLNGLTTNQKKLLNQVLNDINTVFQQIPKVQWNQARVHVHALEEAILIELDQEFSLSIPYYFSHFLDGKYYFEIAGVPFFMIQEIKKYLEREIKKFSN